MSAFSTIEALLRNLVQVAQGIQRAIASAAPITSSQPANEFLASPNGTAGTPGFRGIATQDLAAILLPIANGGTGANSAAGALTALGAAALAGNSSQVFSAANGAAANEVVNVGQFETDTVYTTSNLSGTVGQNAAVTVWTVSVTFPSFSKTGKFKVSIGGIGQLWASGGSAAGQPITLALNDGTNNTLVGGVNSGSTSYFWFSFFNYTNIEYAENQAVTFDFTIAAGGSSVTTPWQFTSIYLRVEEA